MFRHWFAGWRLRHAVAGGTADRSAGVDKAAGEKVDRGAAATRGLDRAYVSDFSRFMDGFLEAHPEAREDQRRGRALYWDHRINLEEQEKLAADSVPADGYYYFAPPRSAARAPVDGTGR
jgi:hypothetical protein